MNTFDVRTEKGAAPDKIIFADADYDYMSAITDEGSVLSFSIDDNLHASVLVLKTDVPHLVAALEKAKELGWWVEEPVVKSTPKKPAKKSTKK